MPSWVVPYPWGLLCWDSRRWLPARPAVHRSRCSSAPRARSLCDNGGIRQAAGCEEASDHVRSCQAVIPGPPCSHTSCRSGRAQKLRGGSCGMAGCPACELPDAAETHILGRHGAGRGGSRRRGWQPGLTVGTAAQRGGVACQAGTTLHRLGSVVGGSGDGCIWQAVLAGHAVARVGPNSCTAIGTLRRQQTHGTQHTRTGGRVAEGLSTWSTDRAVVLACGAW